MTEVGIHALGVRVVLDIDDPVLADTFAALWRDLPLADSDDAHQVRVTGCNPWALSADDETHVVAEFCSVVSALNAVVNERLATRTPFLAMHAAVLSRDGVGLAIPGPSGAGKTTLTVALLQRGWRYVSDEALALDWDTGAVQPYQRPLGISTWTARTLGVTGGISGFDELFVRAASLGAAIETGPIDVRHIVLLSRDGSQAPSLVPEHRMEALEMLVRRGFTHQRDPGRALRLLADVVRGAKVHELCYDDPCAAAELLNRTLR